MKGLAFAYDPDGYWVEIVKRSTPSQIPNQFNFSQTMLRIKDPSKSIPFYEALGMTLIRSKDYGDFSNYFMISADNKDNMNLDGIESINDNDDDMMKKEKVSMMFPPVLELTHNHGTEKDDDFKHYNGNEEGRQGFGHIGFLVDDVYEACDGIRKLGYGFKKEPDGGSMKGLGEFMFCLSINFSIKSLIYFIWDFYFENDFSLINKAFAYDPDGYPIEIIKRGGIDYGDVKVGEE